MESSVEHLDILEKMDRNIANINLLGLDVTMLKFSIDDALLFKKGFKQIFEREVESVGRYNGIIARRTKKQSHIVAMDMSREYYSRHFDMFSGTEINN